MKLFLTDGCGVLLARETAGYPKTKWDSAELGRTFLASCNYFLTADCSPDTSIL